MAILVEILQRVAAAVHGQSKHVRNIEELGGTMIARDQKAGWLAVLQSIEKVGSSRSQLAPADQER